MVDYQGIRDGFGELDEQTVLALVQQAVDEGGDADAALQACREGLDVVGGHFESGRYFIGDLIYSAAIMQGVVEILSPMLADAAQEPVGKVVFCTVEGDIHDIGKNIVISLMRAGGLDVHDLGVDVAPEKVVAAVAESGAGIVALSGVLTLAIPSMIKTVEALGAAGLRDSVKVLIGGAPVNADVCGLVGADAWSQNPQEGTRICQAWARG
jgi:methanogenic corrinoid protein MtbC1